MIKKRKKRILSTILIAVSAAAITSYAAETDVSEQLYQDAVRDSAFADEDEILPLVSLTTDDKMTTWDSEGRVLLCTWHNYPDSYPEGENVTIKWGPVWAFTDKEMASHKTELEQSGDPEMRLKQLVSFDPDSEHSTVTGFWVNPENVKRPAYQSDPTVGTMTNVFGENADEEFKEWFDDNILWSYYYGNYPWTRLGYTYDWADNGTEYGLTEFIVESGAEVEVEFTETTEEFLERIAGGAVFYSGNGYTAEKITHPQNGVMETDGIVDYAGNGTLGVGLGTGDRGQNYSWGSIGYGDYMYIGTCYGAWMNTLNFMKTALGRTFDEDMMMAALNEYYHGELYTSEPDGAEALGILVKLNVKTGESKILMSKADTGQNTIFRNAVEFNGRLYFCGAVNALPVIYEVNPETDECREVYAGMTAAEYKEAFMKGYSVGIRGMCVYKDRLIVSCINSDGAVILESKNPSDPGSFQVIADNGALFDYPAYHFCDSIYGGSIFDMTQYQDSLYVTICTGTPANAADRDTMQSFAMVRGDVSENGSWTWTSVVGDKEKDGAKYTFGIDPQRTRSGAANLQVFDGYLYIGEYNDEEIAVERMLLDNDFTFMNKNFEQPVNLYRMDADENVELVVGDADEMFPAGSLSGLGSGFGCSENQYIWKMTVYNDKLYVGTYDASSFLIPLDEYMNDENASAEWKSRVDSYVKNLCKNYNGIPQSARTCAEYLDKAVFGFDLYVTEDGTNFTRITDNGFGDPYNHGLRAFGITSEGLFIGTANPFYGTQVWKLTEHN